jgi:hypothetical protein
VPAHERDAVLRHGLHRAAGDRTFLMAFVQVRISGRRERAALHPLEERADGALVRYRSGGFQSDLTIDGDGFVIDYPQLGRRLPARLPAKGRESS